MKKQKLYLHIGSTKTATTSLQKFLCDNRDILMNKYSLYYPFSKKYINGAMNYNGSYIFLLNTWKEQIQSLYEDCLQLRCGLIISDEFLSSAGEPDQYIEEIKKLFDVTCICYIRDPVGWCYSGWAQRVRTGGTALDFSAYVSKIEPTQVPAIQKWAASFPDIQLLSFEKHKKCMAESFLEQLSCPFDADFVPISYQNTAVPDMAIPLFRRCTELGLYRLVGKLSAYFECKKGYPRTEPFISQDQIDMILGYHKEWLSIVGGFLPPDEFVLTHEAKSGILHNEAQHADTTFLVDLIDIFYASFPLERLTSKVISSAGSHCMDRVPDNFDPYGYLALYPEALDSALDVYEHYSTHAGPNKLPHKNSGVTLDDLEAWFADSAFKNRCPDDFDVKKYLSLNRDVLEAIGCRKQSSEHKFFDPYHHYCNEGYKEKRRYKEMEVDELLTMSGQSPFKNLVPDDFDPRAYLEMNTDILSAGMDPYEHYSQHGVNENRTYKR